MPGASAEILADEVRERSAPTRMKSGDWFRIIDAAMKVGLHNPWAAMVIGFGETLSQCVEHLVALCDQQDRGSENYGCGFSAFKVWPARLEHTRLRGKAAQAADDAIVKDYLREVAIARLALDNVQNHRTVWRTMGFPVATQALRSGANDVCGTGSINAINACIEAAGRICRSNSGFDPTDSRMNRKCGRYRGVARPLLQYSRAPPGDKVVSGRVGIRGRKVTAIRTRRRHVVYPVRRPALIEITTHTPRVMAAVIAIALVALASRAIPAAAEPAGRKEPAVLIVISDVPGEFMPRQ